MYYLGIDLGGTNIAAGLVDENCKILGRAKIKTNTPRPAVEIIDDMAEAARLAAKDAGVSLSDVRWVGVGSPGTVNKARGVIEYANNLGFVDVPMAQMLRDRLGLDCYLENDANAAAYGELVAGAGKGVSEFAAITLGTGVGGGVIANGKMINGFNFAGGELGHMVIVYDGEQCTCGRKGCWEAYASATALIRQTKAAMQADAGSKMWELTGGSLDAVSGRTAFDAMRAGDAAGKAVVDQDIRYIGCGICNVINICQPEVLCVGGGICNEGDTLMKPLCDYIDGQTYGVAQEHKTRVCVAQLGGDAGIIGAAFLGNL